MQLHFLLQGLGPRHLTQRTAWLEGIHLPPFSGPHPSFVVGGIEGGIVCDRRQAKVEHPLVPLRKKPGFNQLAPLLPSPAANWGEEAYSQPWLVWPSCCPQTLGLSPHIWSCPYITGSSRCLFQDFTLWDFISYSSWLLDIGFLIGGEGSCCYIFNDLLIVFIFMFWFILIFELIRWEEGSWRGKS